MANPNAVPPEHSKFKKGQSGNPEGRPKGIPNTATRLKRFLEVEQEITNPTTGKTEKISIAEQMDLAMIKKARAGDVKAYTEIQNRLEGKAPQFIEQKINADVNTDVVDQDVVDKFLEHVKDDVDKQAKSNN